MPVRLLMFAVCAGALGACGGGNAASVGPIAAPSPLERTAVSPTACPADAASIDSSVPGIQGPLSAADRRASSMFDRRPTGSSLLMSATALEPKRSLGSK